MNSNIRRVVTGQSIDGKEVILLDGNAGNVRVRQASGLTSTLLWVTDETPAASFAGANDRADREIGVAPPPNGSIFRIVDFPPLLPNIQSVDHSAITREMGLPQEGTPPRHPLMHRTRSVDYAIILSGEIDMLLDDSEVHLKAGDVVIQQGTNHAWVNHGTTTCRIVFVLIDALANTQTPAGTTPSV